MREPKATRAAAVVWAILTALGLATVGRAAEVTLTPEQRVRVLNEATSAFDRGTELLKRNPTEAEAAFREAVDRFQLLVDSGVRNGRLYYDLANAELQAGQLGKAIVNYRRALALAPGDPRARHNLDYARTLRRNQIESSGRRAFLSTLLFWHYQTSWRSRCWLAITAYLLFWVVMTVRLYWRQPALQFVLLPLACVWLIVGASVMVQQMVPPKPEGVITSDEVVVRKGNGEGFEPQFQQKLQEGVEFILLEQRLNWLYIELQDGNTGWIRSDQAELI